MRAVWYEKKGPAREVLILGEKPTPVSERRSRETRLLLWTRGHADHLSHDRWARAS